MATLERLPATLNPKCSTYAGWGRHWRKNENPCEPCNQARLAYVRKNRATRWPVILEKNRLWREQNPEKKSLSDKNWIQNNPEKRKIIANRWVKNNPEYVQKMNRQRRAKTKDSSYTRDEVINLYGTDCHICNLPIDLSAERRTGRKGWELGLQLDHVIPIVAGGPDALENVRPSHGMCNIRKGGKQ